jgi:hypothetical protein
MADVTIEQAREAKPLAAEQAKRHATVVGVGLTRDGTSFAVKVNLGAAPANPERLPKEVAGVPVRYEVVGRIRPRATAAG